MCVCVCVCVCLSACLSVCLSVCLHFGLYACLFQQWASARVSAILQQLRDMWVAQPHVREQTPPCCLAQTQGNLVFLIGGVTGDDSARHHMHGKPNQWNQFLASMKGKGYTLETLQRVYYERAATLPPRDNEYEGQPLSEDIDVSILGLTVMGFGCYAEKTYAEVVTLHKGYVRWAKEQADASPQLQAFQYFLVLRDAASAQEKAHPSPESCIAQQRQPSHRMFGGRHCSGARMGRWGGE